METGRVAQEGATGAISSAIYQAVQDLNAFFRQNPFIFFRESELHSYLYGLLTDNDIFRLETAWGPCSLVHQEYPTPFRCDMGKGDFRVTGDDSGLRRGHYDLVVIDPQWVARSPREALTGAPYSSFCAEIREKARADDPPFCVAGIEMYLMRYDKVTEARVKLIRQDYRKLLFSGRLPRLVSKANKWRFMDHRYTLVYSHHAALDDDQWHDLRAVRSGEDVDVQNVRVAWTSPAGTRGPDPPVTSD